MGIKRRKGSPNFYYDFTVQGCRFRRSTETDNREVANAVEARRRYEAIIGGLEGKRPTMTIDLAFGRYWNDHGSRMPSAESIGVALTKLSAGLGKHTRLDALTNAAVSEYVSRRREGLSRCPR